MLTLTKTLFGLWTDEGIKEVITENVVIMLLLYTDDVVLFAKTLGDAQKIMKAL